LPICRVSGHENAKDSCFAPGFEDLGTSVSGYFTNRRLLVGGYRWGWGAVGQKGRGGCREGRVKGPMGGGRCFFPRGVLVVMFGLH